MLKDQDFPISVEVQFLGGNGKDERTTANLCTPGTNVVIDGKLFTNHCLSSTSKTYHGDQWVQGELLVLGSGQITHYVNGEEVLEYALPQIGGGNFGRPDHVCMAIYNLGPSGKTSRMLPYSYRSYAPV